MGCVGGETNRPALPSGGGLRHPIAQIVTTAPKSITEFLLKKHAKSQQVGHVSPGYSGRDVPRSVWSGTHDDEYFYLPEEAFEVNLPLKMLRTTMSESILRFLPKTHAKRQQFCQAPLPDFGDGTCPVVLGVVSTTRSGCTFRRRPWRSPCLSQLLNYCPWNTPTVRECVTPSPGFRGRDVLRSVWSGEHDDEWLYL